MELDSRLAVGDQVISREVGGETVLLDLASGVYFGIDEVGTRIWTALRDGKTLSETVDVIVSEYDVGRPQAEGDVVAFVTELEARGLVKKA